MKKKPILIFLILVLVSVHVVQAQEPAPLLPPDLTLISVDLLAIECQNVSDFGYGLSAGVPMDLTAAQQDYQKTLENLTFLLGAAGKPFIERMEAMIPLFSTLPNEIDLVQQECSAVRRDLQSDLRQQTQNLDPRLNVVDYASCAAAGYFVSNGVCFVGGNVETDTDGFVIGLYNADCYDEWLYYPGSCWYCIYGNDEEGCVSKR